MKVIILAGGTGSRLYEKTKKIPKPLIKINNFPLILHIMKIYSHHGYNDFLILTGYKSKLFKDFFSKKNNNILKQVSKSEDWKIKIIYTGLKTMTGGRIKKVESYIKEDNFLLTYGDGLSDVSIPRLIKFHFKHKKIATVTAVKHPGRYGVLKIVKNNVKSFKEKNSFSNIYINGGFFVLNKKIFKYLKDDETTFEEEPMRSLAKKNQMAAFKHEGFWKSVDTMKDKNDLEKIFSSESFFMHKL